MARTLTPDEIRAAVAAVPDPELPMVSIADLGILRAVDVVDGPGGVLVRATITPTYSGCPAMDAIRDDIAAAVAPLPVVVNTVLAPAWTTDDVTEAGRRALADAGIAPPSPAGPVPLVLTVRCPQCGSPRTRELSRFGSTSCKALWVCAECAEPFDRFREHR